MSKFLHTIVICLFAITALAESERAKPTFDICIERNLSYASIDEIDYYNVTVSLKAAKLSDTWVTGVKVIVKDNKTGKTIYSKRFSKSLLYGFSDGTIQVGKGDVLTQVSIYKSMGDWKMIIKEKGIY